MYRIRIMKILFAYLGDRARIIQSVQLCFPRHLVSCINDLIVIAGMEALLRPATDSGFRMTSRWDTSQVGKNCLSWISSLTPKITFLIPRVVRTSVFPHSQLGSNQGLQNIRTNHAWRAGTLFQLRLPDRQIETKHISV